uniref:SDR family NAD(P)-dependent oxidoreductase n=1 Tax=Trinickia soli TaxID=380675 RepID=UPI0031455609
MRGLRGERHQHRHRFRSILAGAVARLRAEGATAHAAPFDVTSPEDVQLGVARIERDLGAIDILVNNAGMQRRAPLEQFSHAQWEELMKTANIP